MFKFKYSTIPNPSDFPGKPASPANVLARHMPYTSNKRPTSTSDSASSWFPRRIPEWRRGIWALRGFRPDYEPRRGSSATSSSCPMRRCPGWAAREPAAGSARSRTSCPNRTSRWSTASTWRCSTRPPSRTLWRRGTKSHWI